MSAQKTANRWLMIAMATLLMVCLGTVYAWSYFQTPIMKSYGWNNSQVSLIFSFAIFFLGISAAIGGVLLPRVGPRKLAMSGSALFSLGYAIAALALSIKSLSLLYIGYGLIGGTGLGLGYVTPVATIAKWFPDRKGFATGIVIMGFGFGALAMSKILGPLFFLFAGNNLVTAFLLFAALFFALTVTSSVFLQNPPADRQKAARASSLAEAFRDAKGEIFSARFLLLWIMFFCNISAGITIVGFQSPMFQDLLERANPDLTSDKLAAMGATLIAITSLFNGFGRFFWGAISDRAGRIRTFRIMLGSEVVIFILLIVTGQPIFFAVLLCWVLLCYGGGFGIMPSAVVELFNPNNMTVIYGAVLTAWAAGGVVGPQITAFIKDRMPAKASMLSFVVGVCFVAASFGISLFIPVGPKKAAKKS